MFDALTMAGQFMTNESFDVRNTSKEHILWSVCALIYKPDVLSQVHYSDYSFTWGFLRFLCLAFYSVLVRGNSDVKTMIMIWCLLTGHQFGANIMIIMIHKVISFYNECKLGHWLDWKHFSQLIFRRLIFLVYWLPTNFFLFNKNVALT